jgi:hypothetical protein
MMFHLTRSMRVAALALAGLASAMAGAGARGSEPIALGAQGSAVASSPAAVAPVAPTGGADPYLPTGPAYFSAIRRPQDPGRAPACSFRQPVCVHARRGVSSAVMLATLTELERASALLVDTLGLPAPLLDGRAGGTSAFDLYLVPPSSAALAGAPVAAARDEPDPAPFDRSSAFGLMREDAPAGCVRTNWGARAFAAASSFAIDAAETSAVRDGNAAYLAELVAPCGTVTTELIDDFQSRPERAITSPGRAGLAGGLALAWYVDVSLGRGAPGIVPTALGVISGQRTRAGSLQWDNEPDFFDALRSTLKARSPSSTLADFWIEFAIARLFMGSRDDGLHFPETAFAGSGGRIRFDWRVPYGSLPRRVSPERPIDPTGATYIWIDLEGAPANARLVFRAEWEAPVPFRWALVRVGADGAEVSRVLITPQQKATSAEKNLDALEGLAGVAVVGINIGDLALDDPFDPDHTPYEPHSYVLTIAADAP